MTATSRKRAPLRAPSAKHMTMVTHGPDRWRRPWKRCTRGMHAAMVRKKRIATALTADRMHYVGTCSFAVLLTNDHIRCNNFTSSRLPRLPRDGEVPDRPSTTTACSTILFFCVVRSGLR